MEVGSRWKLGKLPDVLITPYWSKKLQNKFKTWSSLDGEIVVVVVANSGRNVLIGGTSFYVERHGEKCFATLADPFFIEEMPDASTSYQNRTCCSLLIWPCADCKCAFESEQNDKGLVKNRWTGIWEQQF